MFLLLLALPLTILAVAIIAISNSKNPFKALVVQGLVHHSLVLLFVFFS